MTLNNASFILELLNEPDYIKFVGDKNVRSIDDAKKHLSEKYLAYYQKQGIAYYLVSLKSDKTAIGTCGLVNREGLDYVDIGYAFLKKYRGKGYAFEATKAMLDFAQNDLNLNPIVAITTIDNIKSISLLERLGMKYIKDVYIPNDTEKLKLFMTK